MQQLVVESMQWSALAHIADVDPIGDADRACLDEIRETLARHGKLARFGVSLLHSHFDLAEDEILMETTDVDAREHRIRPVKREDLARQGIVALTTVVGFDERGHRQICGCDPRSTGHHHK